MRRQRQQAQRRLRHDAERALAADEERQQVVAGDVLPILAAEREHGAAGKHDAQSRDVPPGRAVRAARGPPAFSAMLPPIVQEPREDGSGG